MVFDHNVLALDETCLLQTLIERGYEVSRGSERRMEQKPDHRLLPARHQRRCDSRTAEKCNECPSPHGASPPAETSGELRLSHSGATPVAHYSKIGGQCLRGLKGGAFGWQALARLVRFSPVATDLGVRR